MRITGGKYLNRLIKCPPGEIRPAMDRMRESMFSILGNLRELSFLDLFSGSGVIALEAASRGSTDIFMVELDIGKKKVIEENLNISKEKVNLTFMDARVFIRQCKRGFDIIHLDPPFSMENKLNLLELVNDGKILKPQGTLMMHYPGEESYPQNIGELKQYDIRKYGRSRLIFYTRE